MNPMVNQKQVQLGSTSTILMNPVIVHIILPTSATMILNMVNYLKQPVTIKKALEIGTFERSFQVQRKSLSIQNFQVSVCCTKTTTGSKY